MSRTMVPERMATAAAAVRDLVLDLLYPRCCAGCGRPDPEANPHICWECFGSLLPIGPPFCDRCGDPVAGSIDQAYLCSACSLRLPGFDQARSCLRYEGLARALLLALKYHGAVWLADDLGRMLLAAARACARPETLDAVVCVPLYPARRRERGYNQADLLARRVARGLERPLLPGCLFRTRPTATQTRLTAAARLANVKGAFRVRRTSLLEGRRLLLIDDVMTTGATTGACARALKQGGAAEVRVLTVARG